MLPIFCTYNKQMLNSFSDLLSSGLMASGLEIQVFLPITMACLLLLPSPIVILERNHRVITINIDSLWSLSLDYQHNYAIYWAI